MPAQRPVAGELEQSPRLKDAGPQDHASPGRTVAQHRATVRTEVGSDAGTSRRALSGPQPDHSRGQAENHSRREAG